jgi:hypothetical protein
MTKKELFILYQVRVTATGQLSKAQDIMPYKAQHGNILQQSLLVAKFVVLCLAFQ